MVFGTRGASSKFQKAEMLNTNYCTEESHVSCIITDAIEAINDNRLTSIIDFKSPLHATSFEYVSSITTVE